MMFHPRKNHLLVQGQNNRLFQFELRSYLLLNKGYTGVKVCLLIQMHLLAFFINSIFFFFFFSHLV
jgi:hypothetical protein